jgi:hypothetical protein
MRRVEVSSSPGPSPFSHSPECVEKEFCELRLLGILRSSSKHSSPIHRRVLTWLRWSTAGLTSPVLHKRSKRHTHGARE